VQPHKGTILKTEEVRVEKIALQVFKEIRHHRESIHKIEQNLVEDLVHKQHNETYHRERVRKIETVAREKVPHRKSKKCKEAVRKEEEAAETLETEIEIPNFRFKLKHGLNSRVFLCFLEIKKSILF
jgi:beta-N-acetylglucosaminidase